MSHFWKKAIAAWQHCCADFELWILAVGSIWIGPIGLAEGEMNLAGRVNRARLTGGCCSRDGANLFEDFENLGVGAGQMVEALALFRWMDMRAPLAGRGIAVAN
jgi:hypothetical protein